MAAARGIRLYSYAGDEDAFAQHGELAGAAVLVEEMPAQHEQLNRLNPHCLNTVRVTTYTDRDDVHVILSTIRTAKDDSVVDNFHAGGFCMAVNSKTGVIFSDGVDGQERVYVTHPVTGVTLRGFALPNWEKALDVVRRASRIMYELPKCRFLGWDIAFLANGEVAVLECNWRQGRGNADTAWTGDVSRIGSIESEALKRAQTPHSREAISRRLILCNAPLGAVFFGDI